MFLRRRQVDRRARECGSPELQFRIHQEVFRNARMLRVGTDHTSPSTVILTVLDGSGYVRGDSLSREGWSENQALSESACPFGTLLHRGPQ